MTSLRVEEAIARGVGCDWTDCQNQATHGCDMGAGGPWYYCPDHGPCACGDFMVERAGCHDEGNGETHTATRCEVPPGAWFGGAPEDGPRVFTAPGWWAPPAVAPDIARQFLIGCDPDAACGSCDGLNAVMRCPECGR